jgi:ABC-2 type transport system permease protein
MRIAATILFNEMRRIWMQPLVWIVLGLTFIVIALLFLVLLNNFYLDIQVKFAGNDNAPGVTDSVFHPMLFWSSIIGALMMPIFTLRIVTEEKIRRQDILLTSAPIKCTTIITTKLLAIISVAAAFALLNLIFPLTMSTIVNLDWGKIAAGIIGMLLFQASYAAICVWIATLTQNIMFTLLSCLGMFLLSFILFYSATSKESASNLFLYISSFSHLLSPLSGLITSTDIFYFIIVILLFSTLSIIHLRFKKD